VLVLALGLIGIAAGLAGRRRQPWALIWPLSWLTLMIVRALPIAPGHDGIRLFLPSVASLAVLAGLMSGEPFSYQGKHHHIEEITFAPRPIQTPRIPIWIGGFWPRKAPALRAAHWDGFCPARLPDEQGSGYIKPADIRDIKTYIAMHRSSSAPFDLVVGGHTPGNDLAKARAQIEPFIEAGATWWCEFVLPGPGEADRALTRIKQGPPRG